MASDGPSTSSADDLLHHVLTASSHLEVFSLLSYAIPRQQLRQKYLKLCVQLHPDKNPSPLAHKAFQRLGQAYDFILSHRVDKPEPSCYRSPPTGSKAPPCTEPVAKQRKSWWQGKTLKEIEEYMKAEQREFEAEVTRARAARAQAREKKRAKRQHNADRVKQGEYSWVKWEVCALHLETGSTEQGLGIMMKPALAEVVL
eukprot:TRINITY_DN8320_c0_g1_i3.p1 TRINITY_DN8320_c0_g1~~TRINITY_DN8320_c0_g1_i3.p1  ORF type:complete len:200 (+),score=32.68 TRINITY_DN8320_c0_g1_i3:84-683(+)